MTVADLFIRCLEAGGVTTAYGVPGEENTQMMLALKGSGIDVVLTRHEQAAAFMASVHGRLTGAPAVCFSTLGPGATNLMTGVADAQLDAVPMVVLTGQGARHRMGKSESHQIIDLEALFRPVTKLSRTLMHKNEVASAVAEALREAAGSKPGAVHLCLPEDLAAEEVEAGPVAAPEKLASAVMPNALVKALETLSAAQRPLIVAGAGVLRSGAADVLRDFCKQTQIALASTFMAKGILPPEHPLHLHCIGQGFEDHIDPVIAQADLIIAVGFDPIEIAPDAITAGGTVPVLHIAETPASLEHDWKIIADIPGDIGRTLRGLLAGLTGTRWSLPETAATARDRIAAQRRVVHGSEAGFHPADVLRAVEHSLTPDTLVLSGVGTHKMEVARYLAALRPGQIIIPNGLAGMGLALPGAIAAARLGHFEQVLAICGDGEFLMNVQDMETAHRLGVSLTVLLWEDGGYGLIKSKQVSDTGGHTELDFTNPEWPHLALAFGWTHKPVRDMEDLRSALSAARTGLNLVTLPIDYAQAMTRDDAALEAAA